MPDNLPGLSADGGAGRKLTDAEFRKRELERKALEIWIATQSYVKVKNDLKLRSNDVAREMVRKGEQRWMREESEFITRYKVMVREDLLTVRRLLVDELVTEDGHVRLEVVDRLVKTNERLSKLLDLDLKKEMEAGGVNINIITALPPPPATRTEIIDSTAEDQNALSAPEDSEGA